MAGALISVKIYLMWLYCGILGITQQMVINSNNEKPPEQIFYFFVAMIFLPEIVTLFSKNFRYWIKQGIENADGKLNKSDLKDMSILYVSLWCLRVFIFMSWTQIFYQVDIPFHVYITPLLGAFGLSGLPILKSFLPSKK